MRRSTLVMSMIAVPAVVGAVAVAPAQAAAHRSIDVKIVNDNNNGPLKPYAGDTATGTEVDSDSNPAWADNGTTWEIEATGGGSTIRNLKADKCLQPKDGLAKVGAAVVIRPCNGRGEQVWRFVYDRYDPHLFQIAPAKKPRLVLALKDAVTQGHSMVQLKAWNSDVSFWRLDEQ